LVEAYPLAASIDAGQVKAASSEYVSRLSAKRETRAEGGMTERDGTPLPWVGRQGNVGRAFDEVATVRTSQMNYVPASDNPLDQLCDALHIRRPKGPERTRALDAVFMMVRNVIGEEQIRRVIDQVLAERQRPARPAGQPDDPGPDSPYESEITTGMPAK